MHNIKPPMQFKFKFLSFILDALPILIYSGFCFWLSIKFYEANNFSFDIVEILIPLSFVICGLSPIPIYRMLFQYLHHSLYVELKESSDSIELVNIKVNSTSIIDKSEILKILDVHSIFTFGYLSFFSYLVLYTNDRKFIITCYTINKDEFLKQFANNTKIDAYEPWFPTIKKRYREGVMN
jgi:hypothetical protein